MIEVGNKVLSDADCKYVLSDKPRSGDDSQIYITKEIVKALNWELDDKPKSIQLTLIKDNIVDSLKYFYNFDKSNLYHKGKKVVLDSYWYKGQMKIIDDYFGDGEDAVYNVTAKLLGKKDKRPYLNGLTDNTGLNIQEFLIPKVSKLFFSRDQDKIIITIGLSLRDFTFQVFSELFMEFGINFINENKQEFDTRVGSFKYKGVRFSNYFGNAILLGWFDKDTVKKIIAGGDRFRYHQVPISIEGNGMGFYFSTEFEYNKTIDSNIWFYDFKKFIEDYSKRKYTISKTHYGVYQKITIEQNQFKMPIQKIFFGPPGTGKSHYIKTEFPGRWPRVTFHPELDYQGFIGAYKPIVIEKSGDDMITYQFVEEAFLRAYCEAWKSDEPYYLIIEEINRGNCAQIFGDIFQLLDRNKDGYSEYPIVCSPDITKHLSKKLSDMNRLEEYFKVTECKEFTVMSIPNNLNILCTMNTSDQSLFPMDSAFKRRWDWQYIPINYDDADKFTIDLDKKKEYNWGTFIKKINENIKDHTQSEDKQIGNRFLSSSASIISADQFVSKVVFYLWSEIYKDEYNTGNSIFFSDIKTEITFSDFFVDGKINIELTMKFIDFNLRSKAEGAENIDLKGVDADDEDGIIENG